MLLSSLSKDTHFRCHQNVSVSATKSNQASLNSSFVVFLINSMFFVFVFCGGGACVAFPECPAVLRSYKAVEDPKADSG